MQVKIFIFRDLEYDDQGFEKSINSWLTENPNVKVKYVKIEILARGPGESLIIFVFYEGELGKGKFDAELVG